MYNYDEYDRPKTIVKPSGSTTTYTYSGNSVAENKDGVSVTKTNDASGMLVSSEDGGGKVIYTYRPDGQPENINTEGVITDFDYDDYGRQTKLIDPSAGTVQTAYDDANHKVTQTWNSGKNITTEMNKFGQPINKTIKDLINTDITSSYTYENGKPASVTADNGTSKVLTYDPTTGRLSNITETVNGKTYQEVYGYDNNRMGSVTYNTGSGTSLTNLAAVVYKYNTNGYLNKLVDGNESRLWEINSVNALGQETNLLLGNGLTTTKNYTPEGLWTNVTTTNVQNMSFDFNRVNGSLNSRTDNVHGGLTESFTYDGLYRLKSFGSKTMDYSSNGNILNKTDVGAYTYPDASKPYTLGSVNTSSDLINQLNVDYTVMSRPTSIRPSLTNPATIGYNAVFTYNDDYDRAYMQIKQGTTETLSKIYFGGGKYEIETVGGIEKQRLYVDGSPYDASVLLEKSGSISQYYYLHRDYLGSITQITNNNGNLAAEYSYDAWGRMRNPVDWTPYPQSQLSQCSMPYGGRGYTGHEQLNQFGLINMNARLYDPLLARFLAPDAQVSAPETSNGFNRYKYASNNPLMYVDSNGEQDVLPGGWKNPNTDGGNGGSNGAGNNNYPPVPYRPDYNPNPGGGVGGNFYNPYSGPNSGYQNYTGYQGGYTGSYGGNGNTTALGSILFSFLREIFGGSNTNSSYKANMTISSSPSSYEIAAAKPINLPKPVGTGASMVYSGGGYRRGNVSSSGGINNLTPQFNQRVIDMNASFGVIGNRMNQLFGGPIGSYGAKLAAFGYIQYKGASTEFMNPKIFTKTSIFRVNNGGYVNVNGGNAELFAPDDFGNYFYGVAAHAMGIMPADATQGAGLYGILKHSSKDWTNVFNLFDTSRDTEMIRRGYYGY